MGLEPPNPQGGFFVWINNHMKQFNENWDGVTRPQALTEQVIAVPTDSSSNVNFVQVNDEGRVLVTFKGAGSLAYDTRNKEMATRLKEFAQRLESGRATCEDIYRYLTDDKKGGSGNLTAYLLKGFAEAEKLLSTPQAKRKLSMLKKGKP